MGDDVQTRLARLTVEQRAGLSSGADFWSTKGHPDAGIRSVRVSDGPHGLRVPADDAGPDGIDASKPATCFPPAAGLASTWNRELVEKVGVALGREALALGVDVVLGPGVNIKRSPLGGRNFEYFSEDPLVSGALGAAMVRGLQSVGVGACPKHFAVNNQETDRMRVDAIVDERTIREIYLSAFEHIVRTEQPWTLMSSYNFVNGVAASNNHWLLTTVLREEWGYRGLVMSDWGAVYDRAAAVAAGCDLEMPTTSSASDESLVAALESGAIADTDVDRAASVVVALGDRVESADRPELGTLDRAAQHEVALAAARESVVLLKNDAETLPLQPGRDRVVAVVGRFAETPRFQGGGSSRVDPFSLTSALDELRRLAPTTVEIRYAAGFAARSAGEQAAAGDRTAADPGREADLVGEAAQLASDADTTVLFVGLTDDEESEGFDRTDLLLPPAQVDLLRTVADRAGRLVVVLSNGGVVQMQEWCDSADAILEGWLLGEAGGEAVAEILFGEVSPSGKLAETIPLRLEDNPSYPSFPGEAGEVRYGEGVFVGYRYYDTVRREVQFPFGHGLTYTTFTLSDLATTAIGTGSDLTVDVGLTVTNVGSVSAAEVVQVYVAPLDSPRQRPAHELRAFSKIVLAPGEGQPVSFELDARAFARWEPLVHDWVVDTGRYEIRVGVSSRDIRLASTLELTGNEVPITLDVHSTLAEWLDHITGRDLMLEVPGVRRTVEMEDRLWYRLLEQIPVSKLSGMAGFDLTLDQLAALAAEANARAGRERP